MKKIFSDKFCENVAVLESALRPESSFDLSSKDIKTGKLNAKLYFINGFCKDDVMERVISRFSETTENELAELLTAREFSSKLIPYVETKVTANIDELIKAILSGEIGLIVEGYNEAIIIGAKEYPMRSVDEPQNDRVLRGAHDGFVESVTLNSALIRRRIRDCNLTMEMHTVGIKSKTDVVICYMENRVNRKMLDRLRKKIDDISINSLTMSQQSLIECLVPKQWLNPFPKVRYTERPDAAAATILEGSIIVLTDNSPAAMMIPTGIFDFLQDTNDYYLPPVIGSYIRVVRMLIFALTLLLIPTWFLLIQNEAFIPEWLDFIKIERENTVPVVAQLFIVEIVIDALKLASINTPSSLNTSFSVIGALVLGEFAVSAGWFVSEVVLYMAFVAMSNFAQPSFELGYAFKLLRMMMIFLTWLFNLWGYLAGILIIALMLAFTKTVTGQCYLYPLIPFNGSALLNLLLRRPTCKKNN